MQFSIKLAYVTFCQRKWIRKLFGLPSTNKNCERGYNHPNDKHDEIKKCEVYIWGKTLLPKSIYIYILITTYKKSQSDLEQFKEDSLRLLKDWII